MKRGGVEMVLWKVRLQFQLQSLLQKGDLLSARTPPFTKLRRRPLCHTFISRKDGKCDISYCHIHFEFTSNPTSQQ